MPAAAAAAAARVDRVETFRGGSLGKEWLASAPPGAAVQTIDEVLLVALVAKVASNDADPAATLSACSMIEAELPRVCGYPATDVEMASPWRCGRDYGCVELNRVSKEGRTPTEQNFSYSLENHADMLMDAPRVKAYADAIGRAAYGKRALDIGAGPHCLLSRLAMNAGAVLVDSVEQNGVFVQHSLEAFAAESSGDSTAPPISMLRSAVGAAVLTPLFHVVVSNVVPVIDAAGIGKEGNGAVRCRVDLKFKYGDQDGDCGEDGDESESEGENEEVMEESSSGEDLGEDELAAMEAEASDSADGPRTLRLHHGYSSGCPGLTGPYDLVVHEILGHVASAEGVVGALLDLHHRQLLAPDTCFIPSAAGTSFVRSFVLNFCICIWLNRVVFTCHDTKTLPKSELTCRDRDHALTDLPAAVLCVRDPGSSARQRRRPHYPCPEKVPMPGKTNSAGRTAPFGPRS
jgi:hypothetical protein